MADTCRWWADAVFYEIYIRSFQDSDGDGVGDLNGIASRLDYLADLGVTALWITPFYPSPQVDFGYDIANHEAVDPQFGTLDDFDRLVDAAHRRGIRIVVDIVLNHTSDRHAWFEASRASVASPLRDWYVWRDGAPAGGPPNNWQSVFGGPAWTFDARAGQWYYHAFYPEQPDLNWRNPAVEARMHQVLRFWLDRGVDGFRLDAVSALFEDPELRDNPPLAEPRLTLTGVDTQIPAYSRRPDEVHAALRRLRSFVDARAADAVLISEAYPDTAAELARFYGDGDEMHLPFNFFIAEVPSLDAAAFGAAIDAVAEACGDRWLSLVLSNHDVDRACDRLSTGPGAPRADGGDADAVARLLAALLLTLRGTPFIYYGEEIGMRTEPPARLDEVRDPVGRRFWPMYKGRDGVRRPMPWTAARGHGFTNGTPWLAFTSDAAVRNVAAQIAATDSTLTLYRTLVRVRRERPALRHGDYRRVTSDPRVLAFARRHGDDEALVAINMSPDAVEARLDGPPLERRARGWRAAACTHARPPDGIDARAVVLRPYEALVLVAAG
jgi:alpha-glucosidase